MSKTYNLACKDCHASVWIGQGRTAVPEFYLYLHEQSYVDQLTEFLGEHQGHHLEFGESEKYWDYDEKDA